MGFPDSTYVFVRVLKPFSTHVALLESTEGTFESLPSMELVVHISPLLARVNGVAVTNIQTMSKEREWIIPFQISHLTVPTWSLLINLINNLFIVLLV